mgnify:CR=1 FL=1
MSRIYNFNAGPAALPLEVLQTAQAELIDFNGTGMSILESSHRAKAYAAIHQEAKDNIRELMGVPENYSILFLQGGASTQFSMVPMNLLTEGKVADYTNSGTWANKAIKEAKKVGKVNIVADCQKEIPTRVPSMDELKLTPDAAYLHITTNETISGAQWKEIPNVACPIVADMSSDILSRPIDVSKFGLIYAGAQKNLGPSGLTVVIIRNDLAEAAPENLPTMLQYRTHIAEDSLYNTPPCYGIYICGKVFKWIKKMGGLEAMKKLNEEKAAVLYDYLDSQDYYIAPVKKDSRSMMNVTFVTGDADLDKKFCAEAAKAGLVNLKGHRSVGGMRASIYNAMPYEGVEKLVAFMKEFAKNNPKM